MTVEELISELEKHPLYAQVVIDSGDGKVNIDEVEKEIGLFSGIQIIIR